MVSASSCAPSAAPTPRSASDARNAFADSGETPANSFGPRTAVSEWNATHASRLARTFAQARANISRSKHAHARGGGALRSHRARCQASKSAVLAPIPLKGLIGCAASPMAVTRDRAFAPVGGFGGSSRSYSGPAQQVSQSVASNIAGTGACHVPATDRTNARTETKGSPRSSSVASFGSDRGAFARALASASATRTLICHMLLRTHAFSFVFGPASEPSASAFGVSNGIVKMRARAPSRV